jgi:hypothetical protein
MATAALWAASALAADQPQWGQAWSHNMVSEEKGAPGFLRSKNRAKRQMVRPPRNRVLRNPDQDKQDELRIDQNPPNDEPFVLIRACFFIPNRAEFLSRR